MATIKERIEQLEARLGALQDGMTWMELSLTNRLHQIEETINKLSKVLLFNNNGSIDYNETQNDRGRQIFPSKLVELEFQLHKGSIE